MIKSIKFLPEEGLLRGKPAFFKKRVFPLTKNPGWEGYGESVEIQKEVLLFI